MWEGVSAVFGSVVDAAKDVIVARETTRQGEMLAADTAGARMAEIAQSQEFRRLVVGALIVGAAVLLIRQQAI